MISVADYSSRMTGSYESLRLGSDPIHSSSTAARLSTRSENKVMATKRPVSVDMDELKLLRIKHICQRQLEVWILLLKILEEVSKSAEEAKSEAAKATSDVLIVTWEINFNRALSAYRSM